MSGKAEKVASKKQPAKAKSAKGAVTKAPVKAAENLLTPAVKKSLRIGGAVRPTGRDLTRYVKWPRNVRVQRQRKVLYQRLKVPPAISVFRSPLDKAESHPLFALLSKYRPETAAQKKERIAKLAAEKAAGGAGTSEKPNVLKFGLNHITYLIENKKAKLVVIASDVEPIELVIWLPALCRKFGVPYAIVNNKGRLGALVEMKTATAVAVTSVRKEDEAALAKIAEVANAKFRDNVDARRKWGGGIMGLKTQRRLEKRDAMIKAELAKKAML